MNKTQLARDLCNEFPNTPNRMLGRMLYEKYKEVFTNQASATSAVRRARGASGAANRRTVTPQSRANQETPELPPLPKSQADEWLPYALSPGLWVSLSDIHVPYHSDLAVEAALAYIDELDNPNILLNGDVADFYSVSRWDKNPTRRNLYNEVQQVNSFLDHLQARYPNAKIVYKKGNHEDRWDHYLWRKAPELFGLEHCQFHNILELEKRGIDCVAEKRPVLAGPLAIFHGHELPKGLTNPVNQARGAFLRTLTTCLTAHGHRSSTHPESNVWHEVIVNWSQGCLCDLNPEYAPVNKWNWGFATIDLKNNREFQLTNLMISTEGVIYTT